MQALGFIETKGFVAAVEAADSALKSASVSLVGYKSIGGAMITVILTGDVSAVKAGVEAGASSASAVGKVLTSQVIASPHEDMAQIIFPAAKSGDDAPAKEEKADETKTAPKRKSPGI
jgi:ethanolamine utilization protein EutM